MDASNPVPGYVCVHLNDEHFLLDFDTGHDGALDSWLRDQGKAFAESNRCRVWVLSPASDPTDVMGFFSLSTHSITSDLLERKDRDGIPKQWEHPSVLLGKFAVDRKHQGTSAADILMTYVYLRYRDICELSGTRFLTLHVREQRLLQYYGEKFGFRSSSSPAAGHELPMMYKKSESIFQELTGLST